jgi:DNA-directed RNA polymerase subunit RPC12/RpoP
MVVAFAWIPLYTTSSVYSYGMFFVLYILVKLFDVFRPVHLPLLASRIHEHVPNPDSVYVKCLNCGSAYHYGPDKVAPDLTVVCQNCNRTINLQCEIDQNSG